MNTSRGEVLDTQTVIRGLKEGVIGHAVIDVWENEPNLSPELVALADIATPHIAGYSADSKRNASKMSVKAFFKYFGLKCNWHAAELAAPAHPEICIDQNISDIDAACQMFLATYDILYDDRLLRADQTSFETQRGNYPLRREIGAFHLSESAPHKAFLRKFGVG